MKNVIWLFIVFCAVIENRGESLNVIETTACENQENGSFVKSPTSCHHYLFCVGGKIGYEGRCTKGLAFNQDRQVCTDVKQVDCLSDSILVNVKPYFQFPNGDENDHNDEHNQNDEQVHDDVHASEHEHVHGNQYPEEHGEEVFESNEEQDDPNHPGGIIEDTENVVADTEFACQDAPDNSFARSQWSCQKYFHCVQGKADFEGTCPEGYAFNFDDQICDLADLVNCAVCPSTGTLDIADPDVCNFFTRCIDGVATKYSCVDGFRFDKNVGTCRPRNQVQCDTSSVCARRNQTSSIVVGDYNDCKKFYVCLGETTTESFCTKDDHFFNPAKSTCDVKEKVTSCLDGIPVLSTELVMSINNLNARPIRPPGPDDGNPNARPIVPTTTTSAPDNDEWTVPNGPKATRAPPTWGPPRAPGGGFGFPPIIFPPPTTTRRPRPPGGLGIHRPEAPQRPVPENPPSERDPIWGPPRNPSGGGGWGGPIGGGGGGPSFSAGHQGGPGFNDFGGNGMPQQVFK